MQKDLNTETLAQQLSLMLNNLNAMSDAAQRLARLDATEVVANYCIAEAKP